MTGLLCQQFQLSGFKDWQYNMNSEALKGKNTLIVQPTGAGKSLCYQFPSVWTGIVLMPTISLMFDQAKALQTKGIEAAYFGAKEKKRDVVEKTESRKTSASFHYPRKLFNPLYYCIRWNHFVCYDIQNYTILYTGNVQRPPVLHRRERVYPCLGGASLTTTKLHVTETPCCRTRTSDLRSHKQDLGRMQLLMPNLKQN